jgi:hypothetical protein
MSNFSRCLSPSTTSTTSSQVTSTSMIPSTSGSAKPSKNIGLTVGIAVGASALVLLLLTGGLLLWRHLNRRRRKESPRVDPFSLGTSPRELFFHGPESTLTWVSTSQISSGRKKSDQTIAPPWSSDGEGTPFMSTDAGSRDLMDVTLVANAPPPSYEDRRIVEGRSLPTPPTKKRPRFFEVFAAP